jgi:glyoxylase-like metal-dependent hydrolase (beta-lactamase superfamily II)
MKSVALHGTCLTACVYLPQAHSNGSLSAAFVQPLTSSMAAPSLPLVQRLSPAVHCLLGCNPGHFTLAGTNTYLVGTSTTRTLIDTSDGSLEYINQLVEFCKEHGCNIGAIVVTHSHGDHIGGVRKILAAGITTTDVTVYQRHPNPPVDMLNGDRWEFGVTDSPHGPYSAIHVADETRLDLFGITLIALATPGHTTVSAAHHRAH